MDEICIGNIIQVTENYIDETTGQDLYGWKGRVRLIYDPTPEDPETTYLIEWTAETIREQISEEFIAESYDAETAWSVCYLPAIVIRRLDEDHPEIDAEWEKEAVGQRIFWPVLGREGKIISEVFNDAETSAKAFPMAYWYRFLQNKLVFPVKGVYEDPEAEDEEPGNPLVTGDRVRVTGLSGWGYPLGVLCESETLKNGRRYIVPLQDIESLNAGVSKNDRYLNAYKVWLICRS